MISYPIYRQLIDQYSLIIATVGITITRFTILVGNS